MLLSEPVSQVKHCNMFLSLPYCWRSLLLSLLLTLCLPSTGNSPVLCSHLGSAFISKPPSFCLQLRGGCGNKCGNQKVLLQGRSERSPGKGGNHQRWQNITVPASFQLFVFGSCTGSCVWSWSLWSATYRWSEPSRCSSSAGPWVLQLPTSVFLSAVHICCAFTIICFLETGHQLDRTDQPLRHSWTQVSSAPLAWCISENLWDISRRHIGLITANCCTWYCKTTNTFILGPTVSKY